MPLEHQFSIADIARMVSVSARTARRRMLQYGLESSTAYSTLTDSQLDEITSQFVHNNRYSGRVSYQGLLRSVGLRVQQSRVRESLRRVDERGMKRHFRQALHHRQYSVCMPNSLWRIDGHHKLVRWRLVVHYGIDGYSRLVVFLRASTNNKAKTMLTTFLDGVNHFGLPSRVRCDKGGEASKSRARKRELYYWTKCPQPAYREAVERPLHWMHCIPSSFHWKTKGYLILTIQETCFV